MERLKLKFPDEIIFSTTIPVLISHINYGNHVGNDSFASLLHEARIRMLQQFGFTELNIAGLGLIMTDLTIQYKQQLIHGNSVLINMAMGAYSTKGFELYYQIKNEATNEDAAIAKTTMLFYDYAQQKIAMMPSDFAVKFGLNLL